MFSRLFPALLPLVTATAALAQAPREVTLGEALALAARHDPTVVQARGGVRTAGFGVLAARGAFLPSLSASGSRSASFSEGPQRIDPVTSEVVSGDVRSGSLSWGLTSSVELFSGFRRSGEVRAARGQEDAADAALVTATAASGLQTSLAFFDALSNRELLRVREEGVQRAERQLAIAVARLQTRAASVGDSLRAEVQLVTAELALVNQEAGLAAAEANLARRLGLTGRVAARADASLDPAEVEVDTAALMAEATSRAPEVLRAEAAVRAAEGSLTAARSGYWPTVRLSGNYNFAGSNANNYELFNSRSVSLSVSVPIFNQFTREQGVAARQTALDTERATADDARRQVAERLTAQLAQLDAARRRIALTRRGVEAARAAVAVALERYQLGTITIIELTTAQDELTQQEQGEVDARFAWFRAKAQIEAILGRTL